MSLSLTRKHYPFKYLSETQWLYHTWNLLHIHAVTWNKEI